MRTGPTGTPLMATYHSSVTLIAPTSLADWMSEPRLAGGSETCRWNAPASAPAAGELGALGFAAERLVARLLVLGGGRGAFGGGG
jgi:hypothetical protein